MSHSEDYQNGDATYDDISNTELHRAVIAGNLPDNKKYEKNDFNKRNNNGWTPLHIACNIDTVPFTWVEYLIKKSTDAINILDNLGNTPLHLACATKNYDKVKILCSKGAHLEARNKNDDTPVLLACASGACEIVKYLLWLGAKPNIENINKQTIQTIATNQGKMDMMEAVKTRKGEGTIRCALKSLITQEFKEMRKRLISKELSIKELKEIIKSSSQNFNKMLENKNIIITQLECQISTGGEEIASLRREQEKLVTEYEEKMSNASKSINSCLEEIKDLKQEYNAKIESLEIQLSISASLNDLCENEMDYTAPNNSHG